MKIARFVYETFILTVFFGCIVTVGIVMIFGVHLFVSGDFLNGIIFLVADYALVKLILHLIND